MEAAAIAVIIKGELEAQYDEDILTTSLEDDLD
jgi:hypothetical protein